MIKVDCFILNPPYGSDSNTQICCNILKSIKNKKSIIICPPTPAFSSLYFQIDNIEVVSFPGIDRSVGIFSINNKKPLFEKQYRYKKSDKITDFYIQKEQVFDGSMKSKMGIKVRKMGNERECKHKVFLNITNDDYIYINKLIDNTDFGFWTDLYKRSQHGPKFLVPNLLSKTDHAYLVEEVKK